MFLRYCGVRESKSYHDVLDSVGSDLGDMYLDENEVITENLALETDTQTRTRLDSFYSTTSRKSTYFSTGSASSYHSMEDNDNLTAGIKNKTVVKWEYGIPSIFKIACTLFFKYLAN